MSLYSTNRIIADFTTPQSVSTLTVLLPFTYYGEGVCTLLFCVVNLSGAETVTATIQTSEDGIAIDTDKTWKVDAKPNEQATVEVGPGILRSYWRIAANTQAPYNSALVKWRVKGIPRGVAK